MAQGEGKSTEVHQMLHYRSLKMTTDQEDKSDFYPLNPPDPLSYLLVSACNISLTLTNGREIIRSFRQFAVVLQLLRL
jgi:hypothetical protein